MLDAHQLNVFLAAAETLNFTEAGRRVHLSQPSVSQHIQMLEQHFNTKLFIRAGRHIELTDAGRTLVPLARDLVNKSIHIDETMRSLDGEVYGHLLVGCSTTPGKYILPLLLARFHKHYPKVTASCRVAPQKQTIEMVCSGEAHFTMASAPYTACRDVEFRQYMTDPLVLIAPLDHPWSKREYIEPEELYDGVFIMRESSSGTLATVQEGLAEAGVGQDRLQVLLELGNPEAIALAVQEGLGVGFVSQIVVTKLVHSGVARVKVSGLNLEREIYLGRHVRRRPTAAQAAFWDFAFHEDGLNSDAPVAEQLLVI